MPRFTPQRPDVAGRLRTLEESLERALARLNTLQLAGDDSDSDHVPRSGEHENSRPTRTQRQPVDLSRPPRFFNKMPPLYIGSELDMEKLMESSLRVPDDIGYNHGGDIGYEPRGDFTRIVPSSLDSYKKLVLLCKTNNWTYYTYGLPGKRKLKLCIKGLPNDVNLDAVKRELQSKNIPVCRIHRMQTKPGLERPHLVMVVVNYNHRGLSIFQVSSILGTQVTVERLVPKIGQCHRCQWWGHSQRYCQRPVKCVKCAGDHWSNRCSKSRDEAPVCANCSGDHTANYKKCPKAGRAGVK